MNICVHDPTIYAFETAPLPRGPLPKVYIWTLPLRRPDTYIKWLSEWWTALNLGGGGMI
jgi:hypothetical protein